MTESAPEIRLESDRTRVFHSPVAVAKSKSSSEAFTFRVMRRRRGGSSPGSAATLHPAPWLRAVSAVTPWAWRPVNSGRRPQAGGAHPSHPRPVPADRHPTRSTLRRPGAATARSASADRRAAEARSRPSPRRVFAGARTSPSPAASTAQGESSRGQGRIGAGTVRCVRASTVRADADGAGAHLDMHTGRGADAGRTISTTRFRARPGRPATRASDGWSASADTGPRSRSGPFSGRQAAPRFD